MIERRRKLDRKTKSLTGIVILQALVAGFFLLDVAADIQLEGITLHVVLEALAAVGLVAGVAFGALQIRSLIYQSRRDENAIATARGAISDLVRVRFAEWRLTSAEGDIALFALKGFEVAEIARLRQTAPGTVRAQLARIYGKAGVQSQVQLMALFLEELVEVVGDKGSAAAPRAAPINA